MIDCDERPGHPLDRTVRGDRRSRGAARPARPGPAQALVGCRADLPGGSAGAAWRPQRASLAADVLRPAGALVPVPAEPARLPQAGEESRAAAGRGDRPPGPPVAVLVRPGAADRRSRPGTGPAPARSSQATVRCRAGVPGGGAGAAGRAQRAPLAAPVLRAAGAPVPLPAATAWIPQAGQGRGAADLQTTLYLATLCPSFTDGLRLLDATPVPCGTSRQTVRHSELAGLANYGYCAAHSRWYWGLKLYLLTTAEGMPTSLAV